MTTPKDTADSLWLRATSPIRRPWAAAGSAGQKPGHVKVDESTRRVRELTAAATAQRQASVTRLKQARLDKEADDEARVAPSAPNLGSRRER
jgi:hypothetical protein